MIVTCERCKKVEQCSFFGRPSDPEKDKAQNGEWLCKGCVPLREAELDEAIATLERFLKED